MTLSSPKEECLHEGQSECVKRDHFWAIPLLPKAPCRSSKASRTSGGKKTWQVQRFQGSGHQDYWSQEIQYPSLDCQQRHKGKTTSRIYLLYYLSCIFSNHYMQVVHLIRDPRAIISSRFATVGFKCEKLTKSHYKGRGEGGVKDPYGLTCFVTSCLVTSISDNTFCQTGLHTGQLQKWIKE